MIRFVSCSSFSGYRNMQSSLGNEINVYLSQLFLDGGQFLEFAI